MLALVDSISRRLLPFALITCAACSGTGQPDVDYPAFAASEAPGTITADNGWSVTLDEASVAFGPVYFCASASGSATLCETALGELLTTTAFNALDATPHALGTAHGFTGKIQSASYDYGINWFLTEDAPTPAAVAPGGHSAHFTGSAVKAGKTIHFRADVDVVPQFQGQRAAPSQAASATVSGEGEKLDIHFAVGQWFEHVDFDLAPAGVDPYVITATTGTRNHGAIVIGMTAEAPPAFVWSAAP
jgi:hypothetical protein